ncbi:MAG TPA: cupin domain-containing protein [Gaiellaceae bacterium]|nr:cupin domain-containing protein [Gaiellaceae bacterium]
MPQSQVVTSAEPLWFLGTLQRVKLDGARSDGRLAVWEGLMPRGAAPPLHSHPQDETLYVLDGELTAWVLPTGLLEDGWVEREPRRLGPGSLLYAPGGAPHTFRVESDTARLLFLSTPAGIEEYVRALAEPAQWPWLQPPPDGPRVPPDRLREVEERLGVIRHAPPPPRAA